MYLQEIITQYETCKVNIYGKEYELVTKITQWNKLKKQNIKYINRLKKNGVTVQYFKIMNPDKKSKNKTIGRYYKLYTTKEVEYRHRKILVEKLLNKNMGNTGTLEDRITHMWELKNGVKTSKTSLNDSESVMLSMMAYYLCYGYDEYPILTGKDERNIKRKEVASFKDMSDEKFGDGNYKTDGEKSGWSYDVSSKRNMNKFKKANIGATNRWKRTRTYRMNNIVSFDNKRANKYHWKKEGLINHEKPYNSEWCVVDTENQFTYKGNRYKISEDIKQYKASRDNRSQMDKILIYEQENKMYFFDQNIEQIKDDKIAIK